MELLNKIYCKRDYTIEFVTLLNIVGTVEWDMTVKADNATEFVTLWNVLDCWMRWECEIRL